MRNASILPMVLVALLSWCPLAWSQESKGKDNKPKGTFTALGTIKGDLVKVQDGGNKITVRYKEMVTTSHTVGPGSLSRVGGTTAKFHLSPVKELGLKEKNQDLELRLMDNAVIRGLSTKELPGEEKSKGKKKEESTPGKPGETNTTRDNDSWKSKNNGKAASNSTTKTAENPLPGKTGEPGSLAKGQIIIVTVLREDLPGYSRLVASTIYILGEK